MAPRTANHVGFRSKEIGTKVRYELSLLDLVSEFKQLCTLCGSCCSDIKIPLYPVELPYLARQLSLEEARHHIRKNPYPFNIQAEFYFVIDGPCPFLERGLCRIYPIRPLVCRIFPIRLDAFMDGINTHHREPSLDIVWCKPTWPCQQGCIVFRERTFLLASEFGKAGLRLIDYLLATVLDDASFAFLYGQEPLTGDDRFVLPDSLRATMQPMDYVHAFLKALVAKYRNPSLRDVEVYDRLEELDNISLEKICNSKSISMARELTSGYLKRIEKYNPSLIAWRRHIRKHSFE